MDLSGWQKVYDELKDKKFEIIAAAQDTAGERKAGKFYDRAKATYTTLIDPAHQISTLYQMVNVPTGVWIDEHGKIVRPPEVAYSKGHKFLGTKLGDDRYAIGLRDWVNNGMKSRFVMPADKLKKKLALRSKDERLADAHFKMAVYFHQQADRKSARKHFKQAQDLAPNNWNYHRQDWAFVPRDAVLKFLRKNATRGKKPYYEPADLPDIEEQDPKAP